MDPVCHKLVWNVWVTVKQKPKSWIRTQVTLQSSDESSRQAAHLCNPLQCGSSRCSGMPLALQSLQPGNFAADKKRMWEGVEVTMIQAASCLYSRYWKTLLCRKWSGTRAAWSPACVSWSPGWSLLWYGELHGLSALVCCLLPHPTLLTLQWESGLIRCVNRPLWLAATSV